MLSLQRADQRPLGSTGRLHRSHNTRNFFFLIESASLREHVKTRASGVGWNSTYACSRDWRTERCDRRHRSEMMIGDARRPGAHVILLIKGW